MLDKARDWFGFGGPDHVHGHGVAGHAHGAASGEGHTHGVIDPSIVSSDRGIWAIKWSFAILTVTAALQLAVFYVSGSVALLADTIHNIGDATTAIPLWIAFMLARRKPSKRFTYGLGRAEDLAGIVIVLIIFFSAIVAGYEAIHRLIHPQPVQQLGWLTVAGFIGFLGNEIVAVFRIRVGRQMNSAALIADGYHARTDGLTSLAVVLGAFGVWLGYPLADPLIGLLITIAIFGIVWQSSRAVLTRMLDGVEPEVVEQIHHAAAHVPGVDRVIDAKARWLGHDLHADVTIAVNDNLTVADANAIAASLQSELRAHMPALSVAHVRFGAGGGISPPAAAHTAVARHHAPEPFEVSCALAEGLLEIVDTPEGERMRLQVDRRVEGLEATVTIDRPGRKVETLALCALPGGRTFQSTRAPAEPHEFSAQLHLGASGEREILPFHMSEPKGHRH